MPTQYEETIVIDGLNASWFVEPTVLQRIHKGGITAVNSTVAAWHSLEETMDLIGKVLLNIDAHPDIAMLVKSSEHIVEAKQRNRTGYILGFQDVSPLSGNLELLRVYRELGVRVIQLTYNFENDAGYGCQCDDDNGLKPFGKDLVEAMNRQGVLIDLSHCGHKTTMDVIEESSMPVAITHANATSFLDHPRNKSDEIIKACAERGGVIGAVAFPAMVKDASPVTVDDYADAILHLVDLVGDDHVGLGPDFMEEMPLEVIQTVLKGLSQEAIAGMQKMSSMQGFASISDMPRVAQTLAARGIGDESLAKILGANWLRLYSQVWLDLP